MSCFSVAFPTKFHFIHVEQQSDNRPNIPYWLWIWGSLVISYRSIPCFYIICFTLDYAPKVENRDTNSGCMSYRYSRATEIFSFPISFFLGQIILAILFHNLELDLLESIVVCHVKLVRILWCKKIIILKKKIFKNKLEG